MAKPGSLIPEWAKRELEESDRRREEAARKGPHTFGQFRTNFMKTHAYEWELACTWGLSAETAGKGSNLRITKTLSDLYPPDATSNWFIRLFKNLRWQGKRIIVFPPSKAIKGFILFGKRYGA